MSWGDAGQGARGGSIAESAAGERESRIQEAGQAAIAHHFACSRVDPLRWSLVPDGIAYLCDECEARVSVDQDGARVVRAPVTLPVEPDPDAYRPFLEVDAIAELRTETGRAAEPGAPVITDDPRRPIVSSEDAIAAFDRLGSDRKAAAELGISRTQLRRLRGKDT